MWLTRCSPRHLSSRQVKSTDVRTKALALEKLTYLHMLGYDMSWAAFHVVEVRLAGTVHGTLPPFLCAPDFPRPAPPRR